MYSIQRSIQWLGLSLTAVVLLLSGCNSSSGGGTPAQLDVTTWGLITAPVYGTSESGAYAGAELLAGPNKYGSYFAGVLPNGRVVKPAGVSTQVGMDPLGIALTPDGKYLITGNSDELEPGFLSYQNPMNHGSYSLSVIDTATMQVVNTWPSSPEAAWQTYGVFLGLQVTGAGPYTLWASGGADNDMKIFTISTTGVISPADPSHIVINPITPNNQGFVTNCKLAQGVIPVVMFFGPQTGVQATFPAGFALSRNGRFLYVACNADNSVAVIDTTLKQVVKQIAIGYFPYGVSLGNDDRTVTVSNWGSRSTSSRARPMTVPESDRPYTSPQ